MKKEILVNLAYVSIVFTVVAQCIVGGSFYFGQGCFLIANTINVIRDFMLKRPAADKIKNVTFWAITIGIILFNYFLKKAWQDKKVML